MTATAAGTMRVYFHHTQDTQLILDLHARGEYPSHFLYGAVELARQPDMEVLFDARLAVGQGKRRGRLWRNTWRILTRQRHFDVLYGTSFNGLELLILLRALGLMRRPIAIWHHQPVVTARSPLREFVARFFYRGIDRMYFFSQPLVAQSLRSGKVPGQRMQVADWGPELAFYQRFLPCRPAPDAPFISTGKEERDMPTLIEAAGRAGAPLAIYLRKQTGDMDYERVLGSLHIPACVQVHWTEGQLYGELAKTVAKARCVVICCRPTNYTVGLTTLVEAMGLGLPVIATRNRAFPFDIDAEGMGITVEYGDVDGWERALRWVMGHPAEALRMGERGRQLAEQRFNIRHTAEQVAAGLRMLCAPSPTRGGAVATQQRGEGQ